MILAVLLACGDFSNESAKIKAAVACQTQAAVRQIVIA